jgi:hypothetical protein
MWRHGIVMAVLICLPLVAMAQRDYPTRQQLDSLVNPTKSKSAAGMLVAECAERNVGTIGAEEVLRLSYTLMNTTSQPITITEIRSSCSCLRVTTKPQVVKPKESVTIEAQLSTKGRSGEFRHNIFVYTHLDTSHPTERLSVRGTIENSDEWLHLPKQMGPLRVTRKEVIITGCGEERIAVANTSTRPLRLSARSTIEGLSLHTEPEVIEAGKEGDIVICYTPTTLPQQRIETMLIIEGVEASPRERTIRITIKR